MKLTAMGIAVFAWTILVTSCGVAEVLGRTAGRVVQSAGNLAAAGGAL